MVLSIICIVISVAAIATIINCIHGYHNWNEKVNMSFREAMDLTGLPVITFYNGGKKFNFLLDTGANMSVINSEALDDFQHYKKEGNGELIGMEGNKVDISYVKAYLEYRGNTYEEDFQVVDMSQSFGVIKNETGVLLSGILGSSFFRNYKYILDFDSLIAYSNK